MKMKLFGHDTSPYVRRVRALLHELGAPYERDMGGWVDPSADFLRVSPIGKVPVLTVFEEGAELPIFDSKTIAAYLLTHFKITVPKAPEAKLFQQTLFHPAHRIGDENVLTVTDTALDSAIQLFLFERDGKKPENVPYLKRQADRVAACLEWVDAKYEKRTSLHDGAFSFTDLAVACCLDWLTFRHRYNFSKHANLAYFFEQNRSRESLVASDPRLAK